MGNDHLLGNGNLMNEFSEQSDSTFQVLDSKIKTKCISHNQSNFCRYCEIMTMDIAICRIC